MKRSISLLALIITLIAAQTAFAIDATRTVLPNGLTVLQMERGGLPLVVVSILVRAGSLEEAKPGVANLTARLMTEGTSHRSSEQISSEAEFIGAGLGVGASRDFASVSLTVLKKDLDKGFELLSDVLLNPKFADEEIARQKALLKNSLKAAEDDPNFLAYRAYEREVYGPDSPYGRLVQGTPESIDAITREDLVAFHNARYAPNDSIMSVAGDITPAELNALIAKYLGGWASRPVTEAEPPAPPVQSRHVVLIDKPDLTQATINIGQTCVRRDDPDYYALTVMNYVLGGGGFSSRLMQHVRDELGLAYGIRSSVDAEWKGGDFQIDAQTKNRTASQVIDESFAAMRRIRDEGITDKELADAKSFMIGSFPRRFETLSGIAGFLGGVEFYGLGMDYDVQYKRIISAITAADVKRVAEKYLDPDKCTVVVVARQSEAGIKTK